MHQVQLAQALLRGEVDAAILEVIANVVLNIFTNYTDHIAGTEVDFPVVPRAVAA